MGDFLRPRTLTVLTQQLRLFQLPAFLSPLWAMGFVYPFVSVLSKQQHRAEVRFYIWMCSSNKWVLFSLLIPQVWYKRFYQALYNDALLNSKMFFLAPVCVTPGDWKVCKVTPLRGSFSMGCSSSPQFGCNANRPVLFSKASTQLLVWAARALLSAGDFPCWTFEPLEQMESCRSRKWKPAFGLREGSVPASAQFPGKQSQQRNTLSCMTKE